MPTPARTVRRVRRVAIVGSLTVVGVVIVGAIFVLGHSGARATATCSELGAALPDGISLWPPGVRCTGGEPAVQVVRLNGKFVVLTLAAMALLVGAGVRATRRIG
jgi:hypothetical protein